MGLNNRWINPEVVEPDGEGGTAWPEFGRDAVAMRGTEHPSICGSIPFMVVDASTDSARSNQTSGNWHPAMKSLCSIVVVRGALVNAGNVPKRMVSPSHQQPSMRWTPPLYKTKRGGADWEGGKCLTQKQPEVPRDHEKRSTPALPQHPSTVVDGCSECALLNQNGSRDWHRRSSMCRPRALENQTRFNGGRLTPGQLRSRRWPLKETLKGGDRL